MLWAFFYICSPYTFTGKEKDEETGFYYHGARYRDAKYGMWLSTDPALEEYFPSGNSDRDSNLPGQGGVFSSVNLNVYHYGGNNPVMIVDPDGRADGDIRKYYQDYNKNTMTIGELINTAKEWLGKPVTTTPPQYVKQKDDVGDNRAPLSACGISSVAMMTGHDVNAIDDEIRMKRGKGKLLFRQKEVALTNYLECNGFNVTQITQRGGDWKISDNELKDMRDAIKKGNMILYHFAGHYTVMIGYQDDGNGGFNYIFYDPAGDKQKGYHNDYGQNVIYSGSYLKSQMNRGDAHAVKKK